MTISGHFFANFIKIFPITEVRMVILICLTWAPIIRRIPLIRHNQGLITVGSPNCPSVSQISSPRPLAATYMEIFQTTEVQTVILTLNNSGWRGFFSSKTINGYTCFRDLRVVSKNFNWIKSYDIISDFFVCLKIVCRSKFWHLLRKPTFIISKWLIFLNHFELSWKT